jgi:hypothetical protein
MLDADTFVDLPGNWQAATVKAEQNRRKLRVVRVVDARYGWKPHRLGRASASVRPSCTILCA